MLKLLQLVFNTCVMHNVWGLVFLLKVRKLGAVDRGSMFNRQYRNPYMSKLLQLVFSIV